MIDNVLDYAVANSAIFGIAVIVTSGSIAAGSAWLYGRFHERQMRRRSARSIR